jgi:hypothetical protein
MKKMYYINCGLFCSLTFRIDAAPYALMFLPFGVDFRIVGVRRKTLNGILFSALATPTGKGAAGVSSSFINCAAKFRVFAAARQCASILHYLPFVKWGRGVLRASTTFSKRRFLRSLKIKIKKNDAKRRARA